MARVPPTAGRLLVPLLLLATATAAAAATTTPEQLSKTTRCRAAGFNDTTQYQSFVAVPGTPHFLPVYASFDLASAPQLSSVVIIAHGIGGDANTFFCEARQAMPASVGVVAPWFGNEAVRLQAWAAGNASAGLGDHTSLYWSTPEWSSGAGAANAADVASFAAMDALVAALAGGALPQVVVIGFSAGAQMVQRYAWAAPAGLTPVPVKYVISDPSTVLYFDDRRAEKACRPLRDTGANWTCKRFIRPRRGTTSGCPDYNQYRLGLQDLASGSPYFAQRRFAHSVAKNALSAAYLQKPILYVFGGSDTCNCNTAEYELPAHCTRTGATCKPSSAGGPTCCDMPEPTRTNSFVAVNCGDMLQGSNRLQRGLLFTSYLKVFSRGKHDPQVVVIPGMGHDQGPMLNSDAVQAFVQP